MNRINIKKYIVNLENYLFGLNLIRPVSVKKKHSQVYSQSQ